MEVSEVFASNRTHHNQRKSESVNTTTNPKVERWLYSTIRNNSKDSQRTQRTQAFLSPCKPSGILTDKAGAGLQSVPCGYQPEVARGKQSGTNFINTLSQNFYSKKPLDSYCFSGTFKKGLRQTQVYQGSHKELYANYKTKAGIHGVVSYMVNDASKPAQEVG